MLSLLRLTPIPGSVFRRAVYHHSPPCLANRRAISCSSYRRAEVSPEVPIDEDILGETEELQEDEDDNQEHKQIFQEEKGSGPETYRDFMKQVGSKFRFARPCNWLGGEVPFPMNPSFKPPPPVPDIVKERIYVEYIRNPEKNTVRVLSQRYHVSLKRIDAILRLKALEKSWKKGKDLQMGFQIGMEKLLGNKVKHYRLGENDTADTELEAARPDLGVMENEAKRRDVREADDLEEQERRDASRQRYQRQYWEDTAEDGTEPIVPGRLVHAQGLGKHLAEELEMKTRSGKLVPVVFEHPRLNKHRVPLVVSERLGRPTFQFVDVGGKFMDVRDRLKRLAASKRKTALRIKRQV